MIFFNGENFKLVLNYRKATWDTPCSRSKDNLRALDANFPIRTNQFDSQHSSNIFRSVFIGPEKLIEKHM